MAGSDNASALGAEAVLKALARYGSIAHEAGSSNKIAAVVALPTPMDPVRLVGDEDKHATLMFFGEISTLGDEAKADIINTLSQVSQMIGSFGENVLSVDRLGDDEPPALVAKLTNRTLGNLRNIMLVNPKMASYLANAAQYPSYTPHVTFGYPDYQGEAEIRKLAGGLHRVRFDRLALWWGDEKIEFPLKNGFDEVSETDEAAWSVDDVDSYLAHYGRKGMKWGVRRPRGSDGLVVSDDAASARALLSKPATAASNAEIRAALDRMRLEADFNKVQVALIPPSRTQRAAAFAKKLIGEIGNEQVGRVAKAGVAIAVEETLKSGGKTPKVDKEFAKLVGKRIVPKKK